MKLAELHPLKVYPYNLISHRADPDQRAHSGTVQSASAVFSVSVLYMIFYYIRFHYTGIYQCINIYACIITWHLGLMLNNK